MESRQNTSTTTGGSIGASLGEKPKITKVTPDTYKKLFRNYKGGYMMSSKIFKKWYEINIYLIHTVFNLDISSNERGFICTL